jgi:hypothetical protein
MGSGFGAKVASTAKTAANARVANSSLSRFVNTSPVEEYKQPIGKTRGEKWGNVALSTIDSAIRTPNELPETSRKSPLVAQGQPTPVPQQTPQPTPYRQAGPAPSPLFKQDENTGVESIRTYSDYLNEALNG